MKGKRRKLLLCTGKDCRKAMAKHGRLLSALERLDADVDTVRCQKLCKGPVVGLELDGHWEWFGKLRSKDTIAALVDLVERGRLRAPLSRHRDKARSGKLRR